MNQNESPYEVLPLTLSIDGHMKVDIRNNNNQQTFVLTLKALSDNSFHYEIDEKTPIKPRYRVTEALLQSPTIEAIHVTTTATGIQVASNSGKVFINNLPFKMEFYQQDSLVLTVNGLGLMRYEHLRNKPAVPDPAEDPESWEETFNGFTDVKKNGPEAISMDFVFNGADVLFGIPEHADNFALRTTTDGEPYRLFTADVPNFLVDSPMALYGAVPVLYSHSAERTTGIYWQNSAETWVDIRNSSTCHFMSEAGIIDVFVFLGPSPSDAFTQYTKLTGNVNLPQMFSIAYHQCRWNYENSSDVLNVVSNYDLFDIPLDTMWLDIDYTDDKKYFTWDRVHFPDPLGLIATLNSTGRRLTFIIDPHIKRDENYFLHRECTALNYYVKNSTGMDYDGNCWPGSSSYIDFFNPAARKHYADQYLMEKFVDQSIYTGIWNDMNEPAVFDDDNEKTMPRANLHYGGWEHRALHNMYGFMHTKGTFDGVFRRSNGQLRPFILTRSFFAGSQRYAAVWTGDNTADWSYLQVSIKTCLSLAVVGFSFCGSDIGGFSEEPTTELMERWYQAAAYQPFFRNHATSGSRRREPYLFPNSVDIFREAIRARYSLLPLWYTMFYEHEMNGLPIMRPMLTNYPTDVSSFRLDNQYMLSDVLLSSGVSDLWYDIDDYSITASTSGTKSIPVDAKKTPVYQRGGTILPRKETVRKASTFMKNDPVTLFIAVDNNEQASGTLFVDDEESYDYRNGKYLYLNFSFANDVLSSKFVDDDATFTTSVELKRVVIAGLSKIPSYATLKLSTGATSQLEIVNITDNSFAISGGNAKIMEEWEIAL
ncbi:Neutral alpha-glucosidase AB, partial [Pseudolycoriella hygida]